MPKHCQRRHRHRNAVLRLLQMTRSQLAGGENLVLIFAAFEYFQWRNSSAPHTKQTIQWMNKWMDERTEIALHSLGAGCFGSPFFIQFRVKMVSSCVRHFTNPVKISRLCHRARIRIQKASNFHWNCEREREKLQSLENNKFNKWHFSHYKLRNSMVYVCQWSKESRNFVNLNLKKALAQ